MCLNPHLIKKWRKMTKKEAREAKKTRKPFDPSNILDVKFLRDLVEEFLEVFSCVTYLLYFFRILMFGLPVFKSFSKTCAQ